MTIGELVPGVRPEDVLPGASAAAESFTVLEAASVGIVGGLPVLTVRFTADGDEQAARIGEAIVLGTAAFAFIPRVRMTRRVGARWQTLRA